VLQSPVTCYSHIFQSSKTLSKGKINSEVMKLGDIYQREKALQDYGKDDFITLIYKLENYNILVEYLYKSQNKS